MRKILLPLLTSGVVIGVLIFSWFFYTSIEDFSTPSQESIVSEIKTRTQSITQKTSPEPTPILFSELTIPYLRERTYSSELKTLQPIGSNNSYETYLTSYDSDGLNIYGLLTQPTDPIPENGWPAIIFIHGYIPPDQYRTTERYQDYVNYLARNGFVVFKIDLRGHGESDGEANGAYYSSDYIIDTLNAYNALQNSNFVNPKSIGLWGHSMAGNVVLRTIAANPEIPAAVIWVGLFYTYEDFQEYGLQDSSYQRPADDSPRRQRHQDLFDTHSNFSTENEFWKQVVPTNYLDKYQGSIQLHHAQNDTVVNIEYSRNLAKILEEKNITHELFEYSQGGHNISGTAFGPAMNRTVELFTSTLP